MRYKRYIPKQDSQSWRIYDTLTGKFPGGLSAQRFDSSEKCESRCDDLNEKNDALPLKMQVVAA